jgi:hypothetical protein
VTVFETSSKRYSDKSLKELFIGRRIVASSYEVPGNVIFELDNGVRLRLVPNKGCGGPCRNGEFTLTDFSRFDHVITRVAVADNGNDSSGNGAEAVVELFVYGEGISDKIAQVKGSEGNGYYGRGFAIQVLRELP